MKHKFSFPAAIVLGALVGSLLLGWEGYKNKTLGKVGLQLLQFGAIAGAVTSAIAYGFANRSSNPANTLTGVKLITAGQLEARIDPQLKVQRSRNALRFGTIAIPESFERLPIIILGVSGSGKTSLAQQLLVSFRRRDNIKAIVLDKRFELSQGFYGHGDYLFTPENDDFVRAAEDEKEWMFFPFDRISIDKYYPEYERALNTVALALCTGNHRSKPVLLVDDLKGLELKALQKLAQVVFDCNGVIIVTAESINDLSKVFGLNTQNDLDQGIKVVLNYQDWPSINQVCSSLGIQTRSWVEKSMSKYWLEDQIAIGWHKQRKNETVFTVNGETLSMLRLGQGYLRVGRSDVAPFQF